jgi:hypothetical protein
MLKPDKRIASKGFVPRKINRDLGKWRGGIRVVAN